METVLKSKNFELEKLASIPLFFLPKLNHGKDKFAFYWDKTGRMELYLYNLNSREITQLSNGEFPKDIKSDYIWMRDDEHIVFAKDDTGAEKNDIYQFNINTKKVTPLSINHEIQEYIMDSSPDGDFLAFLSLRAGQLNLFTMEIDGSNVQQITAHENPVFGGVKYSPDGQYLSYICNEEGNLTNQDIYLAKPDGSYAERIVQTKIGSRDIFADWSPDGSKLAFTTDLNGQNQAALYDLDTREITYFGDSSLNENALKFTVDGGKLICLRNNEANIYPVVYDVVTGDRQEHQFDKGIAAGGEVTQDNQIILTLNKPTMPSSFVLYDFESKNSELLLETDLGDINPDLFIDSEYIHYSSSDGTSIPAMVYTPRDFDPSETYPGILVPHGGPTAQYFNSFSFNAQFLADSGYVVMYPNVRGSTGYGVEFRDACLMDWGGKDLDDWVAGRQHLIDNYSVAPERVAVFGGSYGGFATLTCVTRKPDLWKTAVAWVPVSHLGNMYEKSMPHFQYFLRRNMGDPVKDKDLWEERSPLNYAENLQAKLLLLHGETDPRCPVDESRNFVEKLKEKGFEEGQDGDFQYIEWKDEGHGMMTDREHRVRDIKAVDKFLLENL